LKLFTPDFDRKIIRLRGLGYIHLRSVMRVFIVHKMQDIVKSYGQNDLVPFTISRSLNTPLRLLLQSEISFRLEISCLRS
jgi:hypothetical protein